MNFKFSVSYVSLSTISTSKLSALLRVHLTPIKQIVFLRSYKHIAWGISSWGRFPTRCFQRLSLPDVATQLCRWHDN
ncbi:hypothetical protein EMGBD1_08240 [Anaerolineaceae bacterium]|nr:hypothetical protein EMGBD1_08240 [Anaerolineaceae bacterium]